jgi:hypothetical protein
MPCLRFTRVVAGEDVLTSLACYAEEDDEGAVELDEFRVGYSAEMLAEVSAWHGGYFIHHEPAELF